MSYHAKQGDIIWLSLVPQAGHEQAGRRPALVVSRNDFNGFTKKTAMVCPITNTDRGFPLHVRLDSRCITTGVVMCDQSKVLDLEARQAAFIERAPEDVTAEAVDIIIAMIEM